MSSTINASVDGIVLTASSTAAMNLATGGTNRLSIDTSGNVGIATGNLSFSATGQRITGDFSNATLSNRLAFQTSTTNGNTIVSAFPNGTGTNARLQLFSASDPANASTASMEANATSSLVIINADKTGTGTYLPMTFYTSGSERMRLDTSGNLGIGTSTPTAPLTIASVSGAAAASLIQGEVNNERLQIRSAVGSTGLAGGTPVIATFGSRGTIASPSASLSGDQLGYYQLGGYDGTNWVRSAWITGLAAENYSATNRGSHLTFATTPIGSTAIAERMRIDSSGNVGIGAGAAAFDKVMIGGTLPSSSAVSIGFSNRGTIPSTSTTSAYGFNTALATQAASFTTTALYHYFAGGPTLGAGSVVSNQFGFYVQSTLTNATNNYGFFSDIASGANRWNFYAAGTARNYFAGRTDVGNTRISEANVWNGVSIDSTSTVTLTSGSSVNLSSSVCGGAIISVYVTGSGNGGLFWANYSATVTKLVGNGEATDTGSDFAVYKNAASHTTTLKNKSGSTQVFAVSILSGTLS